MNTVWEKIIGFCQVVILFTALTFLFYGLIAWAAEKVDNYYRDVPRGRAQKVSQMPQPSITSLEDAKQRLYFYYWFGE